MDWNETTRNMRISKAVCDEFEERGVDLDIVLPDYCPDITAVLKYVMKPTILARHQSGDRYTVDGLVTVRIMYLSEDRETIHCYEATQPFSVGFRCAGAVHYYVDTQNDYINCRAVSPRRIDIHGAFRVHLYALDKGETGIFGDPCKKNVFCRKESVTLSVPMCECEKTLIVNEMFNLGVRMDALVYADVTVSSCEHKILTNKAIVKGIILLKAVCVKDSTHHSFTQEIPFSQIVDADGLNEERICETDVCLCEQEYVLRQNDAGVSVLEYNGKFNTILRCSSLETTSVVLDAYSVDEPLLCRMASLKMNNRTERKLQRITFRECVSMPQNVTEVEDQWCELKSHELTDEKALNLLVTVCVIGRDSEGKLGYYERPLECKTVCDESVHNTHVRLISSTCTISGDQIRVQFDADICCDYDESKTMSVVSAVAVDAKQTYDRPAATIRIVYADEGDSLWEIAKKHHSSVEHICAENDLSDNTIHTATMLMIPMI